MNCPSCKSPLEPNARFCGVCGYRLPADGRAASPNPGAKPRPATPGSGQPVRPITPAGGSPKLVQGTANAERTPKPPMRAAPAAAKSRAAPKGDDVHLGKLLNNRFKIESKVGEGGFGAVYRGTQLATGRKVAIKMLHPEMTKDDNLVARFRREGMVLCNLRDAHTITTYDFDQTPDGELYIAMELLEGKSLHQVFHEQAPLEWKRMFKILIQMCSSLAEAHQQGIVHRDLKPENVYLEHRTGDPEFVKILDFGIAKVMRGDSIDPASPQLTATGQTLGTLEYMSPEQLMGKPLDGRSDVYALGVVAYEMITGRLPFPDAKGPAGLITAQLKQTPLPPSQANPRAGLPQLADKVILRCLEKSKDNRFPDTTQMAAAMQEVLDSVREASNPLMAPLSSTSNPSMRPLPPGVVDLAETRRGESPLVLPPPMPQNEPTPNPLRAAGSQQPPMAGSPYNSRGGGGAAPQMMMPHMSTAPVRAGSSTRWIWWVVGLLALGAAAGAVLALLSNK